MAAMVGDFEDVRVQVEGRGEIRLRLTLDVAGQENGALAGDDAQHHRGVVVRPTLERAVGRHRRNAQRPKRRPLSSVNEADWYTTRRDRLQQPLGAVAFEAARRDP